ncbi:MAG TPA: hypothetical protein VIL49_09540 [Capillimicrobium sp.]
MRPARRRVLAAGGAYYAATGVAPFVSRRAFEAVTGPKADWWLVQTVGVLVTPVGAAVLAAAARERDAPELTGLLAACAAGLAAIDVTHVARGRIRWTYLLDAAAQAALLAGLAASRGRAPAPPA